MSNLKRSTILAESSKPSASKPVHLQKPYADCLMSAVDVAESLRQRIITLPCSTGITEEETEEVVRAVKEAV